MVVTIVSATTNNNEPWTMNYQKRTQFMKIQNVISTKAKRNGEICFKRSFDANCAKRTQFLKYPNERKFFCKKEIWKYLPLWAPKKRTQTNPILFTKIASMLLIFDGDWIWVICFCLELNDVIFKVFGYDCPAVRYYLYRPVRPNPANVAELRIYRCTSKFAILPGHIDFKAAASTQASNVSGWPDLFR